MLNYIQRNKIKKFLKKIFSRKKFSKNYYKMFRKNKHNILNIAKIASEDPFDAFIGLEMFVAHLKFMKDYYELGENVWSAEDNTWDKSAKNLPSRLGMLEEILTEYDNWMNCDDKYYKLRYCEDESNEDKGKFTYEIEGLLKDKKENATAYKKEYEEHKRNFFKLIVKYIERIWD